MANVHLHQGIRFMLRGREYVIKQQIAPGEFQIQDIVLDKYTVIKTTDLRQLLFRGELDFMVAPENLKQYWTSDFGQLSEELKSEAKRRIAYVHDVLEATLYQSTKTRLQSSIENTAKKINDPSPPSLPSLYRWKKDYERSGGDIRSLVTNNAKKGNRKNRLPEEVHQMIQNAISSIYLTPERPSVVAVHDKVVAAVEHINCFRPDETKLPKPGERTVYREVDKISDYDVLAGRYGKKIADRKYLPVKSGPRPTRVLEITEIDHTKLDLFVVDENGIPMGRPWHTYHVDKFSGMGLGFYLGFDPPSYLSVSKCLQHSILPKDYVKEQYPSVKHDWDAYGIPETLVVDNGKEFHSSHLEDTCLQLGIVIKFAPPGIPWYKGSVERYFRTLNQQLLHEMPGTSFSNIFELADYDPKKNAVISFPTLCEIIHIYMIDINQQKYHRGKNGIPAKIWAASVLEFPPSIPASKEDLNILSGMIEKRQITRSGIELFTLLYNSPELSQLRTRAVEGQKVTVKFDPEDLSCVNVYDEVGLKYLPVPANNQEYTHGLTLWQHRVILNLARKEKGTVDITALALAKERIRDAVSRDWASKKIKGKQRMSRFKGIKFEAGKIGHRSHKEEAEGTKTVQTVGDNGGTVDHPEGSKPVRLTYDDDHKITDIDLTGWGISELPKQPKEDK